MLEIQWSEDRKCNVVQNYIGIIFEKINLLN